VRASEWCFFSYLTSDVRDARTCFLFPNGLSIPQMPGNSVLTVLRGPKKLSSIRTPFLVPPRGSARRDAFPPGSPLNPWPIWESHCAFFHLVEDARFTVDKTPASISLPLTSPLHQQSFKKASSPFFLRDMLQAPPTRTPLVCIAIESLPNHPAS